MDEFPLVFAPNGGHLHRRRSKVIWYIPSLTIASEWYDGAYLMQPLSDWWLTNIPIRVHYRHPLALGKYINALMVILVNLHILDCQLPQSLTTYQSCVRWKSFYDDRYWSGHHWNSNKDSSIGTMAINPAGLSLAPSKKMHLSTSVAWFPNSGFVGSETTSKQR